MGGHLAQRVTQAAAVAALGVPVILLAHLVTTGRAAEPLAAAAVVGAVLAVAAAVPAGTAARLALVTTIGQVAGHTVLALSAASGATSSGCIPAVGRGARFGLHLALLRPDEACPAGTLAPGPTAAALAAVVSAAAILIGHAVAAGLIGLLLSAARSAVHAVHAITAAVAGLPAQLRRLLSALRVPVAPRVELLLPAGCWPAPGGFSSQWLPGVVLRRGPPAGRRRPRPAVT